MKPITPHDPLDDLIAAALHGDLSPEERAQFESRLQTDPAAAAAYHEAQAMNDLLEKTHRSAQPDPDFEQRMVSGVRRKLAHPVHRETPWESLVILWKGVRSILGGHSIYTYGGVCSAVLVCLFIVLVNSGNQVKSVFTTISGPLAVASSRVVIDDQKKELHELGLDKDQTKRQSLRGYGQITNGLAWGRSQPILAGANTYTAGGTTINAGTLQMRSGSGSAGSTMAINKVDRLAANNGTPASFAVPASSAFHNIEDAEAAKAPSDYRAKLALAPPAAPGAPPQEATLKATDEDVTSSAAPTAPLTEMQQSNKQPMSPEAKPANILLASADKAGAAAPGNAPAATAAPPAPEDTRKLIRNAQLDLEVKSFQAAFDQITTLTKAAGGYVDTSNSTRGGNGKLQGTVVVKILPPNLDAFLLKLRDLGDVQNQSVSTDDVTKAYFDTQARLVNSQKMETQLQELLKRENGKVSDLLAVERELGRVRGEIEQMQGQLKLYDFQVQYATVTMNLAEKDLNQTAAYLLKEQDNFSLFATDVEGTFQKARQAAESFKAQVLAANLQHNSGQRYFRLARRDGRARPDRTVPRSDSRPRPRGQLHAPDPARRQGRRRQQPSRRPDADREGQGARAGFDPLRRRFARAGCGDGRDQGGR